MKMSKKIIHVNQNIIRHNVKNKTNIPPCRIQIGHETKYCSTVKINGPSKMIYNNDDPLDCGARLWIETDAEIELIDETTYSEIKNFL